VFGRWLRDQRLDREQTQATLVAKLSSLGVRLSRGHLANLELGRYAVTPRTLRALDAALELDGSALQHAQELGIVADENELIGLAQDFLEQVRAGGTEKPVASVDPGDFLAAGEGSVPWQPGASDDVEATILRTLQIAAQEPVSSRASGPIVVVGFADVGVENDRVGLSLPIRAALRHLLERGWSVVHLVPEGPLPDETALARVVFPLVRCPRFEARIVSGSVAMSDHQLLVPGLAAIQCFASAGTTLLSSAVVHLEPAERDLFARRVDGWLANSLPFVERFDRPMPVEGPEMGNEELLFRRLLVEAASVDADRRLMLGWFSNSTMPPHVYRSLMESRRREASSTATFWDKLIAWQLDRWRAMNDQLDNGRRYWEVVTAGHLEQFVLHGSPMGEAAPEWRRVPERGRVAHLENIVSLMERHENYEIAIATDEGPIARAMNGARWEVRDGPDGVVLIQTEYTSEVGGPEQRVDLKMTSPAVVRAFALYFEELWLSHNDLETNRTVVIDMLRGQLDRLARVGS
jgi:hypothetical protein